MDKKSLAFALAAMFAVSAFAIVVDSEDSDATSVGSTNVFVYNGTTWTDYIGMSGYNALQALQATGLTIVADTDYILEKENDWGAYTEMNSNYGKVTSIGSIAENDTNVWNVFVYNNGWAVGIDAIGYITPFTDGAAPSANLVMYYGADASTVPTDVPTHVGNNIAALINPSTLGASAMYTFNLKVSVADAEITIAPGTEVEYVDGDDTDFKDLTSNDLRDGITVVGCGSNAYAALKNAVGSNISGTETPGAYYGWLNSLFGLQTVSSGSNYIYWTQSAGGNLTMFNLGAYSGLTGVPSDPTSSTENFSQTAFELNYILYSYS